MLCFSCAMNHKTRNEHTRVFVALLTTNAIALFLDEAAWLVQGMAQLRLLNLTVNVLFYMNGVVLVFQFWQYIKRVLKMEDYMIRPANTILNILFIPMLMLCAVNFFYPLYFSVDAKGFYVRADNWYISQLYLLLALLIVVMGLILSHAPAKDRLVAFSFAAIPLLNQVVTSFVFGISTQYAATLVSIVLIYGVLFAKREQAINATETELNMATRIQSDMLPNTFPFLPERTEFDLFASMTPAKEVGGDFYDFFMVDDMHLAIVIADVSGKGVPAALFMMSSKILIKNTVMTGKSPGEVLRTVNNQICENNREEMFVTVWLGILDLSDGTLVYANAGHEYPVLKQPGGDFALLRAKHSFVVGGMPGLKYRESTMTLQPDTKLFVYTDGVPEATDAQNQMFGLERMIDALNSQPDDAPQQLLANVRAAVDGFVQGAEQFDDLTMLCLEYKGLQ
jgi:serine phosphatase RsbU (regulator of sigma subunit)